MSSLPIGLLILAAGTVAPPLPPEFERPIEVAAPGLTAVFLDRHVYEAAREDLGDLRILDSGGDDVAYVLDRGRGEARPEVRPRMRNRGHGRDRSATVVLDFGARVDKDHLVLGLNGGNFRRRVRVEGSDDGESWTTLVEEAWVFAVPGPPPARYETVALPRNDFPLLRLTVHPGQRERMRLEILEAWVPAGRPGRREATVVPGWSRAPEARPGETWLTLDLGARHQPFEAVVLEVADERFFREVRTEIRRDVGRVPGDGSGWPPLWDPLGRDVIFRLEAGAEERVKTRIDARGRSRGLRVRVLNGDDRPLDFESVRVQVPLERVIFAAETGGEYRLAYGSPDLPAPEYDLARTLDETPEVAVVELGPPVRRRFEADVLPWSERHPFFLWIGLLAVVVALAVVTWRALRSV
ncbi:MAG: DUF3999 domain-containing protein [Acidobacteria bacterium]|nr:DUF3999 domain-containing protein [Acidobacteriota bacterium]